MLVVNVGYATVGGEERGHARVHVLGGDALTEAVVAGRCVRRLAFAG